MVYLTSNLCTIQYADTIHIIEVNPRLVSQFADLYEKVDGQSNYKP